MVRKKTPKKNKRFISSSDSESEEISLSSRSKSPQKRVPRYSSSSYSPPSFGDSEPSISRSPTVLSPEPSPVILRKTKKSKNSKGSKKSKTGLSNPSLDESPKRKAITSENKKDAQIGQIVCGDYEKIKYFGKGAYGEVWKVKKGEVEYAAKMISPATSNPYQIPMIDRSIIKEMDLLARLKHPNVIGQGHDFYLSPSGDMCHFLPLMPTDFKKIYDGKADPATNIRYKYGHNSGWIFASLKQMWCGLAYLHANFVVHADLKPENILYDYASDTVKLADYGLSVNFGSTGKFRLSYVIVSAWWRPPEIFALNCSTYVKAPEEYYAGPEVDVYSMGMIGMQHLYGIKPPALADRSEKDVYESLEFLKLIGADPGPLFRTISHGFLPPPPIAEKTLLEIDQNLTPLTRDYFSGLIDFPDEIVPETEVFIFLQKCVQSPPLSRPTSHDFIRGFPSEIIHVPAECEKATITYLPLKKNIEYTPTYTPERRADFIKAISAELTSQIARKQIGKDDAPTVALEAIDLMDRIFTLIPPKSEEEERLNLIAAISLALTVYSPWGGEPYKLGIWKERDPGFKDLAFARTYERRLVNIIEAFGSRIYRPTIDQTGAMNVYEALRILESSLSPRLITTNMSSEKLVEDNKKGGGASWVRWLFG